jgi:hypothetical protein
VLQILGVFAEFEHASGVDRATATLERRVLESKWLSGRIADWFHGEGVCAPLTARFTPERAANSVSRETHAPGRQARVDDRAR